MNNGTPTFSLAYTSVRPAILPQIIKIWDERSKHKDHEWCLSYDDGHEPAKASAVAVAEQHIGKYAVKVGANRGRKNCVDGWNAAAALTTGKVIVAVADDFVPPPNWDEALLALQPPDWIDGEHVIHVNDGFIGHIFTLAILTRKRYDRFGYLWYPGYESMFVDTEFGEVAKRDGVVIEAMHLLFEHMHHACGKRPKDAADSNHENSVRWTRGEMLFNYRKQCGFPVDLGPKAVKETVAVREREFAALVNVNNAAWLQLSCDRLVGDGVRNLFFAVLAEQPDGTKHPQAHFELIREVSDRIKNDTTKVNTKIFKLGMYKFPSDTPQDTTRRILNDALAWVRAEGHQDIVIVDGDELWPPNMLQSVKEAVAAGSIPDSMKKFVATA